MGGAQVLEHRRIGRVAGLGPLALGQVQLEEQDLFELLGAAEVELVPDVGVDLRLEPGDLGRELGRQDLERLEVERDAGRLHPGEHRDERELDLAIEAVEAVVDQPALEGLADGERGERLETGPGRGVELGDRRQDQVELFGHDVGDRLAAQRRVEDVRRDLGVERDRRRVRVRVVADAGDQQRLDLVADDGDRQPVQEPTECRSVVGPLDGHRAAVGAGDRERQRRAAARTRVVEQEPDPDRGLGGEPRFQGGDPIACVDLDARRVGDRGGECRGQVVRGWEGRGSVRVRRGAAARDVGLGVIAGSVR